METLPYTAIVPRLVSGTRRFEADGALTRLLYESAFGEE
jgi:hypothetical protein